MNCGCGDWNRQLVQVVFAGPLCPFASTRYCDDTHKTLIEVGFLANDLEAVEHVQTPSIASSVTT